MTKSLATLLLVGLLTGCNATVPSIPSGYKGAAATIKDSIVNADNSHADFFFLWEIDGKYVDNAFLRTINRDEGHGLIMTPVPMDRQVPAQDASFHIVGRTHFAAPILEMTHPAYLITGTVRFTPQDGAIYVIKGELGPSNSSVWLEDEKTGKQVGNRFVAKGSAELGMFKKQPPTEEIPPE